MSTGFKYCLCCIFVSGFICAQAQSNLTNKSVITIIGDDPVQANNTNDFVNNNSNPYTENVNEPPVQGQIADANVTTIEPTLENGFHMRFELGSPAYVEQMSYLSTGSSGGSTSIAKSSKKRNVTMTERAFNVKKKLRAKLPHRKKKYHPHLCGRF